MTSEGQLEYSSTSAALNYNTNGTYSPNNTSTELPIFNNSTVHGGGSISHDALIAFFNSLHCCENMTNPTCTFLKGFLKGMFMLPNQGDLSKPLQYVLVTLYVLIIAVSITGNSLVLLTFIFNRHMRSTTNIFIVSLAGSDILLSISTVPFDIGQIISQHWKFGRFACKIVPFMTTFSVGCSSLTLCCIALDRFYAIVFPFKLQVFQTRFKMTLILSAVWVLSALSGIPQAKSYKLVEFSPVCGETIQKCLYPKNETPQQQFLRLWLSFGILFVFPLMVMGILYGIIIQRLWGKNTIIPTSNANKSDSVRLRQKKRAIKMLVTVISLFVICWSPLQMFNIITEKNQTKNSVEVHIIKVCLQCLAMSSGCYNPIVYAFMNEKFRKSFAIFLLCRKRHIRIHPLTKQKDEDISRKLAQLKSESKCVVDRITGTDESHM